MSPSAETASRTCEAFRASRSEAAAAEANALAKTIAAASSPANADPNLRCTQILLPRAVLFTRPRSLVRLRSGLQPDSHEPSAPPRAARTPPRCRARASGARLQALARGRAAL